MWARLKSSLRKSELLGMAKSAKLTKRGARSGPCVNLSVISVLQKQLVAAQPHWDQNLIHP